jgi:glutamine synthetase
MIAAGLDGVEQGLTLGDPSRRACSRWTRPGSPRRGSASCPGTLGEAIDELEADPVIAAALGDHVLSHYVSAKRAEWDEYRTQVTAWELSRYLEMF